MNPVYSLGAFIRSMKQQQNILKIPPRLKNANIKEKF